MPQTRLSDQIGRVIGGRYRLVAPLGSGASAEVFLAVDVRSDRQVAVKLLHAALATETQFLRRFKREARAASTLDHPNIVRVIDWGDAADTPFLVTEFMAGGSLRDVLDETVLTPAQALVMAVGATEALDHAHRKRGIIHRDIKPANLLFGADRGVRIADFGLARALAEAAVTEPTNSLFGTARYASPEQAKGLTLDGRSDVYSMALVVVEAITGSVPFAADTSLGTLMARVGAVPDLDASLGALREPLERALAPEPGERPDANAFRQSLQDAGEHFDRPAPIPLAPPAIDLVDDAIDVPPEPLKPLEADELSELSEPPERPEDDEDPRQRRRRWPIVVMAVMLALGLGAAGAYAWVQSQVPSHEIPTLVGKQEIEARAAVDEFGWRIETSETRQLDTVPGEVVQTRPDEGESLEEGEALVLVVSLGNPKVALPDGLVGAPVEEAIVALDEVGLEAETEERFDEDIDAGVVIEISSDQDPEPPIGSTVPLVVSKGPAPRTVPEGLGGIAYADAEAALAQVQLGAEQVDVFSDSVDPGLVVAVDPGSGMELARGSTVKVQVSKGPDLVTVPDISDKSLDDANATIEDAGLVPGGIFGPAKGKPDRTGPEAGTELQRGSTVDIYLKR